MKFRDYQNKIINYATNVITIRNFVYLAMEVRTGKTLTSLGIAQKVGVKNVLFLTKKKFVALHVETNPLTSSISASSAPAAMA